MQSMKFYLSAVILLVSGQSFSNYKANSPFFYAAIAEASYAKTAQESQSKLDRLLGPSKAQIIARHKIGALFLGTTNIILVRDHRGLFHIGFEGSNDIGDWIGNVIINPTRGSIFKYDVTSSIDKKMHRLMMSWKKEVGSITSIVGHSRGGMFASQVPHKHSEYYKGTQIISFNCLKPKAGDNQLHLAVKKERGATLLSSNGRYKKIAIGSDYWRLFSNHRMKAFLSGLKDKDWSFVQ